MEIASVISFIRGQKIQWLEHMVEKNEEDINRAVLKWTQIKKKPLGWLNKRWLDVMEEDLEKMGLQRAR